MKNMKLIMESWKNYTKNIELSSTDQLLIENYTSNKITEEELFNTFNDQFNEELENILQHGKTLDEGRIGDYVKEKVFPFVRSAIDKIIASAQKAPAMAMKLAVSLANAAKKFIKFLGPKGVAVLVLIAIMLGTSIFSVAQAAIPDMPPEVLNAYVGYLDMLLDMAMREFNLERASDLKELVKALRKAKLSGDEQQFMDVIKSTGEAASQVGQSVFRATRDVIKDAAAGDANAAEQFEFLADAGARILKKSTTYRQ